MNNGWICLHRKILKNLIISKPEYFSLFVTLLLLANHQNSYIIINNVKTLINRGQLLTSRLKLSQITGIQESKVERILKYLKSEQQIEQQNLVIGRLITITNYNMYQKNEQESEHGMNSERTASEQRVNTNNNDNNVNNDKKPPIIPQGIPCFLSKELWTDYIDMRKKIKKPLTNKATALAFKKLEKLKNGGVDPNEVLEQSIFNSWTGLFEIRKERKTVAVKYPLPIPTIKPTESEVSERQKAAKKGIEEIKKILKL